MNGTPVATPEGEVGFVTKDTYLMGDRKSVV